MQLAINRLVLFVFIAISALSSGCGTHRAHQGDPLPILTQDELIRPYIKLGRIQVTREMYGADFAITPDIRAWGVAAVRQEAEKMGADAIMLPEITGHTDTILGFIPSTEYRATGFAIKFK